MIDPVMRHYGAPAVINPVDPTQTRPVLAVLLSGGESEVIGIDATPYPTDVIDIQTGRNRPVGKLP